MQCRKSLWLLTLSLVAICPIQAQTSDSPQSGTPAQTPDQSRSPTPTQESAPPQASPDATPLTRDPLSEAQKQQGISSSQKTYPNEEDRVRLAREAQARVRARREQRTQATIKDTYSHKYDLSFGYAYLHFRPGHSLQHANFNGWNVAVTRYMGPKWGLTADFRGFYKNVYVGHVRSAIPEGCEGTSDIRCTDADTSNGHNQLYGFTQGDFKPFISNYSAMGGGEYRLRERKSYAIGIQALAGITYNLFNADSVGTPGYLVGLYNNGARFTAAITVPIDYNLSPGLSLRISPDYNLTTWGYKFDTAAQVTSGSTTVYHLVHSSGTDLQHNLGFAAGLNYRFGR